ncbi:hypothetical protein ACSBR2_002339 [Camellia fascicularis]
MKEPHLFSLYRSPSPPLLTSIAHCHCRKSPPPLPPPQYKQFYPILLKYTASLAVSLTQTLLVICKS